MKPDRTNYEILLIDYLDGTLSEAQVHQLSSFLDANPDIREELEELSQYYIKANNSTFPLKSKIKKSVSDLSEEQFILLSIAACENDISADQRDELESLIANNEGKRKIFEQIKSLRLVPPDVEYSRKSALRKLTITQKVIRLSAIALSAAAGIALMISLFNLPVNRPVEPIPVTAVNQAKDSNEIIKSFDKAGITDPVALKEVELKPQTKSLLSSLQKTISDEMKSFPGKSDIIGSSPGSQDQASGSRDINISKIDFIKEVTIREREFTGTSIAINTMDNSSPALPEESRFSKFIAKTFRERIFKSPTPETGSLKGYEVADAGITGLNKLFGWEMSLQKNRDEKGELKSIRFNSKFVKFNTPVKKAQLQP